MKEDAAQGAKKQAAYKAAEWVRDGMILGLGTGSTAYFAIERIGQMVKEGLQVRAVASSLRSESLAREMGIPLIGLSDVSAIDLTIDGADEIDSSNNLIKGGGGALVREKIIASNSRKFIVVADGSKLVKELGRFPVPVEVVPFGSHLTRQQLASLGCRAVLRQKEGKDYITDNGNLIVDCAFSQIENPRLLNVDINAIPGVVESGLFEKELITAIVIGYEEGKVKVFE